jgi:hypothetical protein
VEKVIDPKSGSIWLIMRFPAIIAVFNRNTIIEGDEKLPDSELNKAWNHIKSI